MFKRSLLLSATSCAMLATVTTAWAGGFYNPSQSTTGLGDAFAGGATSSSADSLLWNPAAIAGASQAELYNGIEGVQTFGQLTNTDSTIKRPGQPVTGISGTQVEKNPFSGAFVPNLDLDIPITPQWAAGFAVSVPWGNATKYPTTGFSAYDGLTSELKTIDLQPTLAWQPNELLGLGAGFDAEYSTAHLSGELPNLSPRLPNGYSDLKGQSWNYGVVIGAMLHPLQGIAIGLSYRSQIGHSLTGSQSVTGLLGPLSAANGAVPAVAKFNTPAVYTLGASWQFAPAWQLNAQTQHFGWSAFKTIDIITQAGANPQPQNLHDTEAFQLGLAYNISQRWVWRGGAQYDMTPTSNANRSVRAPGMNTVYFGTGSSYQLTPTLTVDGAAGLLHYFGDRINSNATAFAGTPAATPILIAGNVSNNAVIVAVGLHKFF